MTIKKWVGTLRALARAMVLTVSVGSGAARAEFRTVEPLSKEWSPLAAITGVHLVVHKRSRLSLRVLEADGSSSVAQNPVALFIVATNEGTSDLKEHVWRLPRGVVRVHKVTASNCGLDVVADVDTLGDEERMPGQKRRMLKVCFLSTNGELESVLTFEETDPPSGGSRKSPPQ